jgi:hypothetical protein
MEIRLSGFDRSFMTLHNAFVLCKTNSIYIYFYNVANNLFFISSQHSGNNLLVGSGFTPNSFT